MYESLYMHRVLPLVAVVVELDLVRANVSLAPLHDIVNLAISLETTTFHESLNMEKFGARAEAEAKIELTGYSLSIDAGFY